MSDFRAATLSATFVPMPLWCRYRQRLRHAADFPLY